MSVNYEIGLLSPVPSYVFPLTLDFLSRFRHPAVDIADSTAYRRVLRQDDGLALVDARLDAAENIVVRLLASTGTPNHAELVERLAYILNQHAFADFWQWARQRSDLWDVLAPVYGLSLPRTESIYDALMFVIIEQQIAWTAAQRAQRLLCEWGGEVVHYEGVPYYAVPSPERLAQATPDELKPLKITNRRAALLIRLASDIDSGALDLEALRGMSPEEQYARLIAINGIGHWTAVVTLTRAFGIYPAVASNDVALRAAVRRYLPQHADAADPVVSAFRDYGDFGGVAATFLLSRYVFDTYPPK